MRFYCLACGSEHGSPGELCDACAQFLEGFRTLVDRSEDPFPALKHFCEEELDWVVFDSSDDYEEDCAERAREIFDREPGL